MPIPFDELVGPAVTRDGGGQGHAMLVDAIDALDRELLGVAHPLDHRFLRGEGAARLALPRTRTAARWATAMPARPAGSGRSRCATRRSLGPVLGHLTSAVVPRGAFAFWVGGAADRAVVPALQAGFRLDPFPVLLCWDRPFADFSRYLPIWPGLL